MIVLPLASLGTWGCGNGGGIPNIPTGCGSDCEWTVESIVNPMTGDHMLRQRGRKTTLQDGEIIYELFDQHCERGCSKFDPPEDATWKTTRDNIGGPEIFE